MQWRLLCTLCVVAATASLSTEDASSGPGCSAAVRAAREACAGLGAAGSTEVCADASMKLARKCFGVGMSKEQDLGAGEGSGLDETEASGSPWIKQLSNTLDRTVSVNNTLSFKEEKSLQNAFDDLNRYLTSPSTMMPALADEAACSKAKLSCTYASSTRCDAGASSACLKALKAQYRQPDLKKWGIEKAKVAPPRAKRSGLNRGARGPRQHARRWSPRSRTPRRRWARRSRRRRTRRRRTRRRRRRVELGTALHTSYWSRRRARRSRKHQKFPSLANRGQRMAKAKLVLKVQMTFWKEIRRWMQGVHSLHHQLHAMDGSSEVKAVSIEQCTAPSIIVDRRQGVQQYAYGTVKVSERKKRSFASLRLGSRSSPTTCKLNCKDQKERCTDPKCDCEKQPIGSKVSVPTCPWMGPEQPVSQKACGRNGVMRQLKLCSLCESKDCLKKKVSLDCCASRANLYRGNEYNACVASVGGTETGWFKTCNRHMELYGPEVLNKVFAVQNSCRAYLRKAIFQNARRIVKANRARQTPEGALCPKQPFENLAASLLPSPASANTRDWIKSYPAAPGQMNVLCLNVPGIEFDFNSTLSTRQPACFWKTVKRAASFRLELAAERTEKSGLKAWQARVRERLSLHRKKQQKIAKEARMKRDQKHRQRRKYRYRRRRALELGSSLPGGPHARAAKEGGPTPPRAGTDLASSQTVAANAARRRRRRGRRRGGGRRRGPRGKSKKEGKEKANANAEIAKKAVERKRKKAVERKRKKAGEERQTKADQRVVAEASRQLSRLSPRLLEECSSVASTISFWNMILATRGQEHVKKGKIALADRLKKERKIERDVNRKYWARSRKAAAGRNRYLLRRLHLQARAKVNARMMRIKEKMKFAYSSEASNKRRVASLQNRLDGQLKNRYKMSGAAFWAWAQRVSHEKETKALTLSKEWSAVQYARRMSKLKALRLRGDFPHMSNLDSVKQFAKESGFYKPSNSTWRLVTAAETDKLPCTFAMKNLSLTNTHTLGTLNATEFMLHHPLRSYAADLRKARRERTNEMGTKIYQKQTHSAKERAKKSAELAIARSAGRGAFQRFVLRRRRTSWRRRKSAVEASEKRAEAVKLREEKAKAKVKCKVKSYKAFSNSEVGTVLTDPCNRCTTTITHGLKTLTIRIADSVRPSDLCEFKCRKRFRGRAEEKAQKMKARTKKTLKEKGKKKPKAASRRPRGRGWSRRQRRRRAELGAALQGWWRRRGARRRGRDVMPRCGQHSKRACFVKLDQPGAKKNFQCHGNPTDRDLSRAGIEMAHRKKYAARIRRIRGIRRKKKKLDLSCAELKQPAASCFTQSQLATQQSVERILSVHYFKIVVCKTHDTRGVTYTQTLPNGNTQKSPRCSVKKRIACFINKPEGPCALKNGNFKLDKKCFVPCTSAHEFTVAAGLV